MWISKNKYNAMLDIMSKQSERLDRQENYIEDLHERIFKLMEEKSDLEKRLRFFGIEIGLPPDPEKNKLDFPKVTKILRRE